MTSLNPETVSPWATLPPFRIDPTFVARVWGLHDLRPLYDYVSEKEAIGEVWLTADDSRVATGPAAGQTLSSLFEADPEALLGADAPGGGSPLLLKVIFVRDKLSVQVHPNDELAKKYGFPRGKTECWYALSAEPGAEVALGLKPGVTLDQVRAAVHDETLEQCLTAIPVATGDLIMVDAGAVHAIWPGSILLETQQYSDLTYRLYDYGRPRPLHVDKALEAIRLENRGGKVAPRILADRTILVEDQYFCVEKIPVNGQRASGTLSVRNKPELAYLFAAAGEARIQPVPAAAQFEPIELPARGIVAVPASAPPFVIENLGGLDLIRISPRWPQTLDK